MKARLILLFCLMLPTLLTGCVAPISPVATADAPEATAAVAPADAPAAVAADDACDEGFRLFDHEYLQGEPLCIPIHPQRILPLDMAALEMTLLMGQTPVGTAQWMLDEFPVILPQFADVLADVDGVGYPAELEQVALMSPDLILAPADTIDIEQASHIAPVVVPDQAIYADWKIGMQFYSEVLNVPDLYAEMEANYWTRVEELRNALGDALDDEISVISVSTYGISLWLPDTAPGQVVADVGLARPAAQALAGDAAIAEYGERQYVGISEERLDLVDADAIFYFTYAAADPEVAKQESDFIQAFDEKPIWQSIDAVKTGRAYFVGGHWWRAQTYLLANLVIDDLFAHLTDTTAATPVLAVRQ